MWFGRKKRLTRIYDYSWNYVCRCKCENKFNITSKDLIVTSFSDWGNEPLYHFKAKCPNCKKLVIVPKYEIPYEVKENVLAESTPIIENEFNQ